MASTIEPIAADLIRALRGTRSQSDFSKRLGYRSNIVHRWESGKCWPSASSFLSQCLRWQPRLAGAFEQFFQRVPDWLDAHAPFSRACISAFLSDLRGKVPIATLAARCSYNRHSVGRWLKGKADPNLPEFLSLIEASSRRLLDFLATLTDPGAMLTVSARWRELCRAREVGYELPWSHAVLRALELPGCRTARHPEQWIAARLGVERSVVEAGLEALRATGQASKVRGKWGLERVVTIETSRDVVRGRELKAAWVRVALERLQKGAPGNYGYSVFAITRKDLRRLRQIHLEYVRAMQDVIAESNPGQCVGLYCAQLLDLSSVDNALRNA